MNIVFMTFGILVLLGLGGYACAQWAKTKAENANLKAKLGGS